MGRIYVLSEFTKVAMDDYTTYYIATVNGCRRFKMLPNMSARIDRAVRDLRLSHCQLYRLQLKMRAVNHCTADGGRVSVNLQLVEGNEDDINLTDWVSDEEGEASGSGLR